MVLTTGLADPSGELSSRRQGGTVPAEVLGDPAEIDPEEDRQHHEGEAVPPGLARDHQRLGDAVGIDVEEPCHVEGGAHRAAELGVPDDTVGDGAAVQRVGHPTVRIEPVHRRRCRGHDRAPRTPATRASTR